MRLLAAVELLLVLTCRAISISVNGGNDRTQVPLNLVENDDHQALRSTVQGGIICECTTLFLPEYAMMMMALQTSLSQVQSLPSTSFD